MAANDAIKHQPDRGSTDAGASSNLFADFLNCKGEGGGAANQTLKAVNEAMSPTGKTAFEALPQCDIPKQDLSKNDTCCNFPEMMNDKADFAQQAEQRAFQNV